MQILEKQAIDNQKLVFRPEERWVLGPSLSLNSCEIEIRNCTFRTLHMEDVRFNECIIIIEGGLPNYDSWLTCQVEHTTFAGELVGNSFGAWPGEETPLGSLAFCDFSQCVLRGCQFLSVDMSTITLPHWPSFTVLDPFTHERELRALSWPGKLNFWLEGVLMGPECTTGITYNASEVAADFGAELTELKAFLKGVPGVEIHERDERS